MASIAIPKLQPGWTHVTLPELAQRYQQVRATTVALCAPLCVEDYVAQSMPDASPAKWHLAHTSWFFEEFVLKPAAGSHGYAYHDETFRYIFNSYYNSVGPMHARPQRGLLTRPTVQQVFTYRSVIDERMAQLLREERLTQELAATVTLGLHHEQQHQELLLTDIKHLFSCNPLLPAYGTWTPVTRGAPSLSFRSFDGGLVGIGHLGTQFCFDNELPRHRAYVAPFQLATRPATNSEYLEFVRDGGYQTPEFWLSDGWATLQREQWTRPLYWTQAMDAEFTLSGLRDLNPHAPVCHLSCYEADAFARWACARLPTEFEWEIAAVSAATHGNFLDSGHLHPVPSGHPAPVSPSQARTLLQMFGDVWEWTQSAYAPYPGFRAAAGALGEYNGKFMVNQLVLRGGSCLSSAAHIRATYRNFFGPAARWQCSGIRLALDR